MARKILYANQCSGDLTIDIANAYYATGNFDEVCLFAGKVAGAVSVPNKNIKIINTIKYNKKNILLRLFSWTISFLHLLIVCWFRGKDTELLLVTNPPFNTFIPLFTRKDYCLVIYDIYPDTVVNQKMISGNSFIAKFWEKQNRKIFAKAKCVFTLCEDMKKVVMNYVDESKIKVVYNWSHNEHLVPIKKECNIFLKERHWEDKFVVLYSGNMGITHDIDIMVDVANELKDDENILFLFIGGGGKKEIIIQKIEDYGLKNCEVLPYQKSDVFPYSLASADIGVITTALEQTGLSIPSKLTSYLSVGAVLVCLAKEDSELGRLVNENNLGKCFNRNEIGAIADFIRKIASDGELAATIKKNSRNMSFKYTPENAKQYIID